MAEINDNVYSMEEVLQRWRKVTAGEKEDKQSVSKKIQYTMNEKLNMISEEIDWFKQSAINKKKSFVFRLGKYTHFYLNDMLYICGKKKEEVTPSEVQWLINSLTAILPYPVNEGDEKACMDIFNQRACRIEQVVCDNYENLQEALYRKSLFVSKDAKSAPNKKKRKEFYKYQFRMVEGWHHKWMAVMEKAGGIRKAERTECVYLCTMDSKYNVNREDEKKFCETGETENEILQGAYEKTKKICTKDLCQYVLWCFITGGAKVKKDEEKLADKATQEDVGNREGCIEACTSLFCEVITHQLKADSIEDFKYISKEAIRELEIINKILCQNEKARERRKKSFYPEVEILRQIKKSDKERWRHKNGISELRCCTEKDLLDLSNIRNYLNGRESETILISDYIKLPTE